MPPIPFEQKVANVCVVCTALCGVLCLMLGQVASWIGLVVITAGLICSGGYYFMALVDYQEKVGMDAPNVERVLNPFRFAEDGARAVLVVLSLIGAWSPTMVIFAAAELAYSRWFRKIRVVDSTRLWKDVNSALFDAKVLLVTHCIHFLVGLGCMVYALLSLL